MVEGIKEAYQLWCKFNYKISPLGVVCRRFYLFGKALPDSRTLS